MMRRLVWLLALLFGWWLLRRFAQGFGPQPAAAQPIAPRFEGAMVRDRICRTFLARSSALSVRHDDEEHFFCSESCRSAYLARCRPVR